jgi:hypothetical protein
VSLVFPLLSGGGWRSGGGCVAAGRAVQAQQVAEGAVLHYRSQCPAAARGASFDGGRAAFAGTAAGLTDFLESLLAEADGVRLHPASLFVDLEELGRLVLPELRRRGVLRAPVQDGTFRDLLGLERPASRYASATAAPHGAGK